MQLTDENGGKIRRASFVYEHGFFTIVCRVRLKTVDSLAYAAVTPAYNLHNKMHRRVAGYGRVHLSVLRPRLSLPRVLAPIHSVVRVRGSGSPSYAQSFPPPCPRETVMYPYRIHDEKHRPNASSWIAKPRATRTKRLPRKRKCFCTRPKKQMLLARATAPRSD